MIKNVLLQKVEPSKSVTLLAKVKEMQKKDPTIINMTGGEPDFPTPEPICKEVYQQLQAGHTHYADSKGDIDLRKAIAHKLLVDNHAPFSEENILVTPGAKYAIYVAIQALVNPGDEVLWLAPGWVSYPAIVTLCGGSPVQVDLDYEKDYAIFCDDLESKTTSKTKLLILNYPNNPTGKILSEQDIHELKKYLRKHPDIYVISDEIYEKLLYKEEEYRTLASDPEFFQRVLVINGFSKFAAMTGWRVGYLACNEDIYPEALKIFQHSMSCTSSFIQKGAIVALQLKEEIEEMLTIYKHRMNLIYEGCKDIPNIECKKPEGAFYVWIKFDTIMNSEELSLKLLEKAHIGGIPGSAYGAEKECMMRFCYACDDDTIKEFIKRLKTFCENELR